MLIHMSEQNANRKLGKHKRTPRNLCVVIRSFFPPATTDIFATERWRNIAYVIQW